MKRIIILGIVVLVVLLLWSGAWLYFAGEIKKNIQYLADADGITNPKITCETLSVGGFPFRFDADCTNGTLVLADTTAKLAELRASVLVYQLNFYKFSAKAPVEITDAFTGSSARLDWTSLEASARFIDNWRIERISIEGANLALNDTVVGDNLIASAAKFELHLLDIAEQHEPAKGLAAVSLYAPASDVVIPGFGITSGNATLEAEINGLPDNVGLLADPAALRLWQQSGGKIQLVGLKGSDGDRFFNATGTLGLDNQARPEGQIKLTSRGLAEIFAPQIPAPVRPMVLGPQGVDGSYAQTFNIRGGVIVSGLIPLGMLPPLF